MKNKHVNRFYTQFCIKVSILSIVLIVLSPIFVKIHRFWKCGFGHFLPISICETWFYSIEIYFHRKAVAISYKFALDSMSNNFQNDSKSPSLTFQNHTLEPTRRSKINTLCIPPGQTLFKYGPHFGGAPSTVQRLAKYFKLIRINYIIVRAREPPPP